MADGTSIEWTDMTWNPITGCAIVSPGCTNCYAMRLAGTRLKNHPSRAGLTRDTKAGPVWTGEVRFNEGWIGQPLGKTRPRMIFVCGHGDLFAEGVTDEMLDRIFAVMALASQHTFQVLTKRPERMRAYLRSRAFNWHTVWPDANPPGSLSLTRQMQRFVMQGAPGRPAATTFPLPNVWLGVSAEDQRRADERVPILLDTPAAVRWVSAEPLLGPIDFGLERGWCRACKRFTEGTIEGHCMDPASPCFKGETTVDAMLHWIVAGGESGPSARPMHPAWAQSIRDQCAKGNVPFLFKQWGSWAAVAPSGGSWPADEVNHCRLRANGTRGDDGWPMQRTGKTYAGRLLDGVLHDAYPQCDEVLF